MVAARWGWRRWRHRRLTAGARLVQILPPPQVEPAAAEALWANLAGLLRLRRPLDPRPHVSFELTWTTSGVTIGLWVPGTVAPRLVERAVEAGWPGARTTTTHRRPPHPTGRCWDGAGGWGAAAGRRARGRRCGPSTGSTPSGPLLGAAGELADGETATVQVLARPAGGRRLARATRAAHALAGTPARGPAWSGGCWTCSPPAAAGGGRGGRPDQPTRRRPWPPEPALAKLSRAVLGGPGPLWRQRPRRPPGAAAGPRPRPGGSLRGLQRPQPAWSPAAVAAHQDPGRPPPAPG